jgi:hypothetical protein
MRTHKDAKVMAKSLRDSLAARTVSLSHSDCLEIVAKQFGFADWNTLSAKLDVPPDHALSCSFCGKSQHEVRSLIEGGCRARQISPGISPCVFICEECVAFCAQVITEAAAPGSQTAASAPAS